MLAIPEAAFSLPTTRPPKPWCGSTALTPTLVRLSVDRIAWCCLARTPRSLGPVRSARGLVPGFLRGSALMRQGRLRSRSLRAQGLCKVTVVVPEGCAEGIRQFAQELRQPNGPVPETPRWIALSPSAELMVSPERGVRCAVRDTRAPDGDRFRWTVAVLGQSDPVAEGRATNRLEARYLAEGAVAAYFAVRAEPSGGGSVRDG